MVIFVPLRDYCPVWCPVILLLGSEDVNAATHVSLRVKNTAGANEATNATTQRGFFARPRERSNRLVASAAPSAPRVGYPGLCFCVKNDVCLNAQADRRYFLLK